MAQRGAQQGNKNAAHDKPWTNALQRALARFAEGEVKATQAINRIADGVVRRAVAGDPIAVKEIAERLDGKPIQPIAGQVDSEITLTIKRFD